MKPYSQTGERLLNA